MSNQVGDCFKFLWPFQDVRTLLLSTYKEIWKRNIEMSEILCNYAFFFNLTDQYVRFNKTYKKFHELLKKKMFRPKKNP